MNKFLDEKADSIKRQLEARKVAYYQLLEEDKISQDEADEEIQFLNKVINTLKRFKEANKELEESGNNKDVFEDGEDLSGKEFDLIACDGETEWRYNNVPFVPAQGDSIRVGEHDCRIVEAVEFDYHDGVIVISISRKS